MDTSQILAISFLLTYICSGLFLMFIAIYWFSTSQNSPKLVYAAESGIMEEETERFDYGKVDHETHNNVIIAENQKHFQQQVSLQ